MSSGSPATGAGTRTAETTCGSAASGGDLPSGRQWVPGYWNPVQGGSQWVSGFWSPTDQEQLTYLPQAPASLDAGPNTPPPSANSVWSPGCWYWQEARYVWRPGFWVPYQADWVWVPAHYAWSPQGCVFVEGYWDHVIQRRAFLSLAVTDAPETWATG